VNPDAGERVLFHGHPSWRSILSFYIKGVIGAVIGGVIAGVISATAAGRVESGWVAATVVVLLVLVLAGGLAKRIQIMYTITNQRLTIQSGVISRELHETRLERVQNVNTRQSLLERMLRVGTVTFDTAGGAEYDFSFCGVAHPHAIVRTVDRALRELQHAGPGV
jgi:uncharacterized membrane protein YdbT with pleckstrin-like domain